MRRIDRQTDRQTDRQGIFNDISEDDLVIAFFPCTRFEAQVPLLMRCERYGMENWSNLQKLKYTMKIGAEQSDNYQSICKMFHIAFERGLRMIVENPFTPPHYLTQYFPFRPTLVDKNRMERGDYMRKPTQYWFLNCNPENNIIFESLETVQEIKPSKIVKSDLNIDRTTGRSLIHPQYANRFIREFILDAN